MVIRLIQFATGRYPNPVVAACPLVAFEQIEIGPDLFRKVYEFGLEGIVSKHRPSPPQFLRCVSAFGARTVERCQSPQSSASADARLSFAVISAEPRSDSWQFQLRLSDFGRRRDLFRDHKSTSVRSHRPSPMISRRASFSRPNRGARRAPHAEAKFWSARPAVD
jgi:hypothetical protein